MRAAGFLHRPSILAVVACAALVFISLAAYLRVSERGLGPAPSPRVAEAGQPPPQVASIDRAIVAMNLVTVMLDTSVAVRVRDESWRGDVDATITVPVRLFYGTDFSKARVDALAMGPLTTAYLVRLPSPQRIATEVYPERETADVRTGWLRFRAMAGEHALGLARRAMGEEARRMVLTPEDAEMIREQTRRRVADLVKAIAGERASVTVAFDDSPEAGSARSAGVGGSVE